MNVAALIISILAVAFAGVVALLTWREQRFRLRPYVFVDRIDTNVTDAAMVWKLVIRNIGLVTAKNVTISPSLTLDGTSKTLDAEAQRSKAIMAPQQVIRNTMGIRGETWTTQRQNVLQGSVIPKVEVSIDYEGVGRRFYYKALYSWNSNTGSWILEDGDAD